MFDVEKIRKDFPILDRKVAGGKPLVYLDNAATTQKPLQVLDAMDAYYRETNSNVHRSIHELGELATEQYIEAHQTVADFIGADSMEEIIFTKNCTEALNLVAYSKGLRELTSGDEVVITQMEHHSNFVPWLEMCRITGAKLNIVPVLDDGTLDLETYHGMLTPRTRLVSFTAMSNVLGTINPVREMVKMAHEVGAKTLVDGAQSVPHDVTDVKRTNEDFMAFSGHKMLGPTGIGVLYGKKEELLAMEPFLFGGEMIGRVTNEGATWNELPWKFEAGTPVIAEAIGLGAACDYLSELGMENVHAHERALTTHAFERLHKVPGVKIYGPGPEERGGLTAIELAGIHAHDLASLLNDQGVAIRAGHHCAQPLMEKLGVPSTARASFYVYTTTAEIDAFAASLERAREVFKL